MHDGKVCEQGPPAQMLDSPESPQLRQFVQSIRNRG
jgi:ABC-type histidine transport system ATPase subunit